MLRCDVWREDHQQSAHKRTRFGSRCGAAIADKTTTVFLLLNKGKAHAHNMLYVFLDVLQTLANVTYSALARWMDAMKYALPRTYWYAVWLFLLRIKLVRRLWA
jgi:hypothetical protein